MVHFEDLLNCSTLFSFSMRLPSPVEGAGHPVRRCTRKANVVRPELDIAGL